MFTKSDFDAWVLVLAQKWIYLSKIVFLIYRESKAEWHSNMDSVEYGKYERAGLCSIKWMG